MWRSPATTAHMELLLDKGAHVLLPFTLGAKKGRRSLVVRVRS